MALKRKTILILAIGVPIVLVAGALIGLFVAQGSDERRIAAAQAELRALGYPTTPEALRALAPPEQENAAPFYRTLIEEFDHSLARRPRLTSAALTPELIAWLDQERPFFTRLRQVRLRPKLWFDRRYEDGIGLVAPEAPKARQMAEMLGRSAVVDARRGNESEAIDKLQTMTVITNHLAQDPLIWSGMAAAQLHTRRNLDALEMGEARPRLRFLTDLKEQVGASPFKFDLRRYIGGDVVTHSMPPRGWEPKDWDEHIQTSQINLRQLQRCELESLARLGKALTDGLSDKEATVLREADIACRRNECLRPLLGEHWVATVDLPKIVLGDHFTPLTLAVFDVMIEEAGGPKAKLDSRIKTAWDGKRREISLEESTITISPTGMTYRNRRSNDTYPGS